MGQTNILVFFTFIFLLLLEACGPANGPTLRSDQGEWLLKGIVQNADFANGDVVAYNANGHSYNSHLVGSEFALYLPENDYYAFFFVKKGKDAPRSYKAITTKEYVGREFATLVFENDQASNKLTRLLRLPANPNGEIIDFGEVEIRRGTAFPENNPGKYLDFDGDKINDYFDIDQKGDGYLDTEQPVESKEIAVCHSNGGQNLAMKVSLSSIMDHKAHGDYTGPCQISAKPKMPEITTNTPAPLAQPQASTTAPTQPPAPTPPAASTEDKKSHRKHRHENDEEKEEDEYRDRKKDKDKKKDKCDDDEKSDDGNDLGKDKSDDGKKGGRNRDKKPKKRPQKKPRPDSHDPIIYYFE